MKRKEMVTRGEGDIALFGDITVPKG